MRAVVLLLLISSCGDNSCPAIADGYYAAASGSPGYTIYNGKPLAFAQWSCVAQPDVCSSYVCTDGVGDTATIEVEAVGGNNIIMTIDGQTMNLSKEAP